ncbi:MAG: secretin N-terminal domain-containing protein [Acidobacteriota bacterium]
MRWWTIPGFGVVFLASMLNVAAGSQPGTTPEPGDAAGKSQPLATRVFVIHHKDLDDVVAFVRPALSENSTVLIQSRLRTVTVTDYAENLDAVESLVQAYDLPPRDVAINVNLVKASRGEPGPRARLTPGHLPSSLREMTQWLDYELLGGMSILTTESERSSLMLGEEYRIRFEVDRVDDRAGRIRLKDFSLERRVVKRTEGESYLPIFDTVVNLKSGTPYVFGATRGESSQRALFLTITANIAP